MAIHPCVRRVGKELRRSGVGVAADKIWWLGERRCVALLHSPIPCLGPTVHFCGVE
jgi:hypothetical protein